MSYTWNKAANPCTVFQFHAVLIPFLYGKEGIESEREALNLPANHQYNPHLWSQIVGSGQKKNIRDTSSQNVRCVAGLSWVGWHLRSLDSHCSSASIGASWAGLDIYVGCILGFSVLGMYKQEVDLGQTQDMLDILYLLACQGMPWCPPRASWRRWLGREGLFEPCYWGCCLKGGVSCLMHSHFTNETEIGRCWFHEKDALLLWVTSGLLALWIETKTKLAFICVIYQE